MITCQRHAFVKISDSSTGNDVATDAPPYVGMTKGRLNVFWQKVDVTGGQDGLNLNILLSFNEVQGKPLPNL